MRQLPGPMRFDQFAAFRADPKLWIAAVADIARSHSLPASDLHVFPNGSNLVVALDQSLILKVFPPMLRHQFDSERTSLNVLRGKISVPIPEIVVEGERDQWPFLVITRMSGEVGEKVWPILQEGQKERVLGQIGQVIAEVQTVPPGNLLKLEPRWDQFIPQQIEKCRARHERMGLPQKFMEGLDVYLGQSARVVPTDCSPVILTGEYIPENFLLKEESTGWKISGLIDFGDVMTGWKEYDLLGPSTFMCGGVPGRVRSLLAGFGYGARDFGPDLTKRLMTLYLLHRYSHPAAQIRIDGWDQKASTLEDLERLIWPI